MVDWGKFPLLSSTAAPSASINDAGRIYSPRRKRSGLGPVPESQLDGGDMSAILYSGFPFFPDILKLGPVVTLPEIDFRGTPGKPVVSFVNQASG